MVSFFSLFLHDIADDEDDVYGVYTSLSELHSGDEAESPYNLSYISSCEWQAYFC